MSCLWLSSGLPCAFLAEDGIGHEAGQTLSLPPRESWPSWASDELNHVPIFVCNLDLSKKSGNIMRMEGCCDLSVSSGEQGG